MKHIVLAIYILMGLSLTQGMANESGNTISRITSVKLYTNMAEVTRSTTLNLQRGKNKFVLDSLPDNLYDWSVRGVVPSFFSGKIISMEVSRKMLLKKRRKKIVAIEKKLEKLREKDSELRDDLANLKKQSEFLNSISNFSEKVAAKELTTRTPNFSTWSKTSQYLTEKRKVIQSSRRDILKRRKQLAKKIQKLEFKLNQVAGTSYYRNYMKINRAMADKAGSSQIQQYEDIVRQYEARKNFFNSNNSSLDREKKIILTIYSPYSKTVNFKFSYIVPGTSWKMRYDFRANSEKKDMELAIYSDIYQKTGEDWHNIDLTLSTGSPMYSMTIPQLYPWYLSPRYSRGYAKDKALRKYNSEAKAMGSANFEISKEEEMAPAINARGVNFAIKFPGKVSIDSSSKYRKKHLRSYKIKEGENLKFFYRVVPEMSDRAFVMANIKNKTALPWLRGGAQVFLDNELMGKTTVPRTSQEQERKMVLGIDSSITARKELVKKYEDKSGLFGGNRKLIYSYRITVENSSRNRREISLWDNFPISRNSKIKVEIKNLSHNFMNDEKTRKTKDFIKGIRKFKLDLSPRKKIEIKYDVVISFDKELKINGLR